MKTRNHFVSNISVHTKPVPITLIFLLLEDPSNPAKRHYTYIKNMSALVAHRTNHHEQTYVCNLCLHPFSNQEALDRHVPFCVKHDAQLVVYPNADDRNDCTLQFKSVQKQHPVPFYIVADFESFLAPIDRAETDDSSGLTIIDEHVVSGFCCSACNLQLKPVKCNKGKKKRRRQSTEEYAKEQYEEQDFFVPCVLHNLRSYDAHFIIKHFQRKFVERRNPDNKLSFDDVQITFLNTKKYLQFQIKNVRFLDSYQFLSTSLDQLVQLLLKRQGKFRQHLETSRQRRRRVFERCLFLRIHVVAR